MEITSQQVYREDASLKGFPMHRCMGYTEVRWESLLRLGHNVQLFPVDTTATRKCGGGEVQPAWVQHPPPVLLPMGLCWVGQGGGLRAGGEGSRTLTCLINPILDSGLLPVQGMEEALCMAMSMGKAPQASCPPTHSGTQLCQEALRSLRSVACAQGSAHPPPPPAGAL